MVLGFACPCHKFDIVKVKIGLGHMSFDLFLNITNVCVHSLSVQCTGQVTTGHQLREYQLMKALMAKELARSLAPPLSLSSFLTGNDTPTTNRAETSVQHDSRFQLNLPPYFS